MRRFLFLLLLLLPTHSFAAISIADTIPDAALRHSSAITTLTFTYTVPSGSNQLLVAFFHVHNGDSMTLVQNGVSATCTSAFAGSASADGHVVCYLVAPTTGTFLATDISTAGIDNYTFTLNGVNQSTPYDTGLKDFISSTAFSTSITTANANEMMIGIYGANQFIGRYNALEATTSASQTGGVFSGHEASTWKIATSTTVNSMGYTATTSGSLQGAIALFIPAVVTTPINENDASKWFMLMMNNILPKAYADTTSPSKTLSFYERFVDFIYQKIQNVFGNPIKLGGTGTIVTPTHMEGGPLYDTPSGDLEPGYYIDQKGETLEYVPSKLTASTTQPAGLFVAKSLTGLTKANVIGTKWYFYDDKNNLLGSSIDQSIMTKLMTKDAPFPTITL